MRTRCFLLSVVFVSLSLAAADGLLGSPSDPMGTAASIYREAPRFAERFEYEVHLTDDRVDRKAIEYGRDGDRMFVAMLDGSGTRVFHVVVTDGVLRAVQFNIAGAYVEGVFHGSLVEAFRATGADRIGLTVPPGLAASEPGMQAFLDAFGFGVLGAMRQESVTSEDGMTQVALSGEAGTAVVRLGEKGALSGLSLTLGEGEGAVRLDGTVSAIEVPAGDERWMITTDGLRPVADFAALENAGYPLGSAAPDLGTRTLDGGRLGLAEQRGRVVVLDFWATWCVPCWTALEHVERLAAWAEESGLPISVWAVDTAEQTTTFEEQAALAKRFLAERGLDLPVAVDVDDSFFAGMHSPGLPSTVLIAPDGTLARFHAGIGDDMEQVLRAEVLELLGEK